MEGYTKLTLALIETRVTKCDEYKLSDISNPEADFIKTLLCSF
jgi:5-carboxymethyl-2-hydroxymuconate isomerase